jgi:hypothetical protein
MAKVKWLERELFRSPVYYCLCTTEKEYTEEFVRLDVKYPGEWLKNDRSGACTHFATHKDYGTVAIVCMPIEPKRTLVELNAMLVHEGTHVVQEVMDNIGEKHPSGEFQAYLMQKVCLELMGEMMRKLYTKPKLLAKIMANQAKIYK